MEYGFLIVESEGFTKAVRHYFEEDEGYGDLQSFLIDRPDGGNVITGAAPLRKIRWRDARRGKSKRGGLRVIYIAIPDIRTFYMLDVYDKDEADDLTAGEKRVLRAMAETLITELRAAAKRERP